MATWADIQRLAADLQRIQASEGEKKLSEHNCIEVISALIQKNAIDVIVTSSGKEYVTRSHLCTEIQNECLANNGRIEITELVPILKVSLEHIEAATNNVINASDDFILCAGELLSREYVHDLCKQLNENLKETGQISMLELAKNWELSTEVFNNYILAELGRRIDAQRIENQLYTSHFLQVQTNKLRAALVALTKPTILSAIYAAFNIPQSLFFNIWNDLTEAGKLNGHIVGGKNSLKAFYIPRLHELLVKSCVKKTFEADGFVSTSFLNKLSVNDAKSYFKDLFSKKVIDDSRFLEAGVVKSEIWSEILTTLQEELSSNGHVVIEDHLPALFDGLTENDLDLLASDLKKKNGSLRIIANDSHILFDSKLVENSLSKMNDFIQKKAKEDAPSLAERIKDLRAKQQTSAKKLVQEDDEDWGSGKKKGKGGKKPAPKAKATTAKDNSQVDYSILLVVDENELRKELSKVLKGPDDLLNEVLDESKHSLNQKYKEEVEAVLRTVETGETKDLKKMLAERRHKAQYLYEQVVVFEQSLERLPESLALELKAYILKSTCQEISQVVLSTLSDAPPSTQLSNKVRDEFINTIAEAEVKEGLAQLFSSLTELDSFHEAVSNLQSSCSILLKSPDKKRKAEVLQEYQTSLKEKLLTDSDPPSLFLIIILYIYASKHKLAITASGKFVGPLIKELAGSEFNTSKDLIQLLQETQKLVIDSIKNKNDEAIQEELNNKMTQLKSLV